ncbi:FH2 domain-containing protein [Flavobacterium branchiicola]|uniref:Uncharacterized protein n=1 Tax=Flavobacterium branchiicola TaxID=1114875 RepID=A0ABV9PBE2_9FLAO|nr:hypothetical protein [Flavobacterium branchiicola]MBS7253340.1 hypothetical protein [Flavobacterium branchiicola]
MKDHIKDKLDIIADVWNDFIYDNKFCRNQINFSPEAESNYFGDILSYFYDTFDIIYEKKNGSEHSENFASHISFLQAIYVQQDFIEEMLILFKTNITKGDLKLDINYFVNREIRNELVGHPFRKIDRKVISSTVFGYERSPDKIAYLRYHADNGFKCEIIKVKIEDIIKRHTAFLETYFIIITEKLKSVLTLYFEELEAVKDKIGRVSFASLVKIVSQKLKPFLENTFVYDEKSIMEIYERRNEHRRYSLVYDSFISDLKKRIAELQENCTSVFSRFFDTGHQFEIPIFDDEFNLFNIPLKIKAGRKKENYHYELGKLSTNRQLREFDHFSSLLQAKSKNETVIYELGRMRNYLYNDVEYFCSYKLIRKILNQDD